MGIIGEVKKVLIIATELRNVNIPVKKHHHKP